MMRLLCFLSVLLLATSGVRADEYWIAYEGNDFPENQGWTHRVFGGGAIRFLDQGHLVIDSRASTQIADFYEIERPGNIDPDPGELFVMQWRLRVDEVSGPSPYDLSVGVDSDESWLVGFQFAEDHLISAFESGVVIPFAPGEFHAYELRSFDMRTYDFFLDGQLVRRGSFRQLVSTSRVGWGDGTQGAASLSRWDYFRFGVVPEPGSAFLFASALVALRVFRFRRD